MLDWQAPRHISSPFKHPLRDPAPVTPPIIQRRPSTLSQKPHVPEEKGGDDGVRIELREHHEMGW